MQISLMVLILAERLNLTKSFWEAKRFVLDESLKCIPLKGLVYKIFTELCLIVTIQKRHTLTVLPQMMENRCIIGTRAEKATGGTLGQQFFPFKAI
jgi:hypothetical protein